jgi:hypothetical protein
LLGNALEALIGAVYLDTGYKGARRFVLDKMIAPHLNIAELEKIDYNFKSKLINWAQSNKKVCAFKVLDEKRADHRILYKIAAFIDEVSHGEAESFNKKPISFTVNYGKYEIDSAVIRDISQQHFCATITCEGKQMGYDGMSFHRIVPLDWKNKMNSNSLCKDILKETN